MLREKCGSARDVCCARDLCFAIDICHADNVCYATHACCVRHVPVQEVYGILEITFFVTNVACHVYALPEVHSVLQIEAHCDSARVVCCLSRLLSKSCMHTTHIRIPRDICCVLC